MCKANTKIRNVAFKQGLYFWKKNLNFKVHVTSKIACIYTCTREQTKCNLTYYYAESIFVRFRSDHFIPLPVNFDLQQKFRSEEDKHFLKHVNILETSWTEVRLLNQKWIRLCTFLYLVIRIYRFDWLTWTTTCLPQFLSLPVTIVTT